MNFRRILSKSSIKTPRRTSSSSANSLPCSVEVSKLHTEIETLKKTVESMKLSLENREVIIGNLAQEKNKLFIELKSAQRTNRNLHTQLADERDIHSKEKEYLIDEIKKVTKSEVAGVNGTFEDCPEEENLIHSMREELKAKDEIICNVCHKYFKIKSLKNNLQKKYERLYRESKKICENIVFLLEENRKHLDNLLKNLIKYPLMAVDTKQYLKLLKVNAGLHFENTQLKICLSQNLLLENEQEMLRESSTRHKTTTSEANLPDSKSPPIMSIYGSQVNKLLTRHHNFNISKKMHKGFSPYDFKTRIFSYSSDPCLARL